MGIVGDDRLAGGEGLEVGEMMPGVDLRAAAVAPLTALIEVDAADRRARLCITPQADALDRHQPGRHPGHVPDGLLQIVAMEDWPLREARKRRLLLQEPLAPLS